MKKLLLLLLCLPLPALSACAASGTIYANYREIDQMQLVEAIGIDSSQGKLTVTVATAQGFEGMGQTRLSAEGESVLQAMRALQSYAHSEELFYGHNRYIVLGEEALEEGLEGYLDFFQRDPHVRINTAIFAVRGGTAKDLVAGKAGEDYDAVRMLSSLERDLRLRGQLWPFTALDALQSLSRSDAALLCALELNSTEGADYSQQSGQTALPAGYAVLRGGRLAGWLEPEEAWGAGLLLNRGGEENITFRDGEGGLVTLQLDRGKAEYCPVWSPDGSLQALEVTLRYNAGVAELEDSARPLDEDYLLSLEQLLNEKLSEAALEAASRSREMNADFLELGCRVRRKDPLRFAGMPRSWEEIFPELPVTVTAESRIHRSFDVNQSVPVAR